MSNLNWVDYVFLIIFFFSIVSGMARGFVKEIVSLITLIAAFVVAILFASPLAAVFTSSPSVQNAVNQASNAISVNTAQPVSYVAIAISFALLFAGTVIIGAILSSILNIAFQSGILGLGNRILGGVFGLVRGFIVNLVIIFVVQLTPISDESWWQQSQVVGQYQPAVQWLANIVSPGLASLKEKFGNVVQDVDSSLQNSVSR
ncbi:MAG: CvpA family protein [Gammaproteobacteria bacterium]